MKTIQVVGAIIKDGDRILATQRGYGDYAGWWEFPGGKVEPGESDEQALVREIREELTAEIAVERYVATTEWDYPKFHLEMRCYLCRVAEGEIELLEHSDAKWVDAGSIDDLKWLEADIKVIDDIKQQGIL